MNKTINQFISETLPSLLSTGWFQEWIGVLIYIRKLLVSNSNRNK